MALLPLNLGLQGASFVLDLTHFAAFLPVSEMALDLDTLGYVSGELSGFFAHLSKAFLQKRDAGTLPPSLFSASSGSLALVPVPAKGKPGRPKKAKKDRAPRYAPHPAF